MSRTVHVCGAATSLAGGSFLCLKNAFVHASQHYKTYEITKGLILRVLVIDHEADWTM